MLAGRTADSTRAAGVIDVTRDDPDNDSGEGLTASRRSPITAPTF
jgi:hypothetical protein